MSEAIDMSRFVEAKSDQLNADDLIGAPRTITVRKVAGNDGDQPVSIYYEGDNNKPFKPCKTMRRVLLGIWGRNAADYVGRSMTLYRDDAVTFGGLNVGGIRISHMSHIDKKTVVVVMKTKGKKAGIEVNPLVAEVRQHPAANDFASYTDKFIARVQKSPDADDLNAFVAKQIGKLDQLPADLRTRADDAVSDMLAKFHPTEGRAD
ncbi:MAG: hypothetical protein B7Y36_19040, partial [Novosphingobium sp. 28-62-57]|uniref:hypothetical protein n=1 Tax=Novosphingobium sp. 28-62-57 TaxID=1970409 RepID=UPI000BC84E6A